MIFYRFLNFFSGSMVDIAPWEIDEPTRWAIALGLAKGAQNCFANSIVKTAE